MLTNARAKGLGRAAVLQCKRGRRVLKRNPDPEGSGPQVADQYINHILEKVFPVPRIILIYMKSLGLFVRQIASLRLASAIHIGDSVVQFLTCQVNFCECFSTVRC